MNNDAHSRQLDCIYAAAWDPGALDEALQGLAQACRSRSAGVFHLRGNALDWEHAYNMPPHFMRDFALQVVPHDPRIPHALARPAMTVLHDQEPELRRAMRDTGVDAFARQHDMPYTMSCIIDRPAADDALALYVSRSASEGEADSAQFEAFSHYAPHFSRALSLRRRIRDDLAVDAHVVAGEHTPCLGALALDRTGRVRWLDGGAEYLLDHGEGITFSGGCLHFSDAQLATRFERHWRALANSSGAPACDLCLPQSRPAGLLCLRLLPNPTPMRGARAPVLVLLRRTSSLSSRTTSTVPLPTSRQGEVLLLLAQGLMSKQISMRLGITENTVRNHVGELLQLFRAPTRTACVARARECGLLD